MLFSGHLRRLLLHRKPLTALNLRRLHSVSSSDDYYFADIHHISSIVRRDQFMERTLNKLHLLPSSDLVLAVLRSCSDHATASFRFFNWIRTAHPSFAPTSLHFHELIKTLARANKRHTIWKIADQMRNHNLSLSPETLCSVIEIYGKQGLVDQAVEAFNRAESAFNCKQSVEVYNSLAFALCEAKMFAAARALVRRMIRKGLVPNKGLYLIMIRGFCSVGKAAEAGEFLEEMSWRGFDPPIPARDLLIEGFLDCGYLESAKDIVKKMCKEGLVPNPETFNTFVETFGNSGEVEFCVELYHEACRLGFSPNINTYKVLILAVSNAGLMDEAFRLLHCSVQDGHKPFPSLYAPIMQGLCRRGRFDDVFSFFGDMKVKGHPPTRPIYVMLIAMSVRGGRSVEAAKYLVEMTELGLKLDSGCFDMVVDGLKKCGKHDLAKRLEVSFRGVDWCRI